MTAEEVAEVDNNLQADLFEKLGAEETLLEADLKHGLQQNVHDTVIL
jgi:hypothetical protein